MTSFEDILKDYFVKIEVSFGKVNGRFPQIGISRRKNQDFYLALQINISLQKVELKI